MKSQNSGVLDRRSFFRMGGAAGIGLASLATVGRVFSRSESGTPEASPDASPGATPSASPASADTFKIKMVDLAFEPNKLTVPADTEITIELTNDGVLSHDFVIDKLSLKTSLLSAGKSETIKATIPAGSYEFICAVEGHAEAGMYGTLVAK